MPAGGTGEGKEGGIPEVQALAVLVGLDGDAASGDATLCATTVAIALGVAGVGAGKEPLHIHLPETRLEELAEDTRAAVEALAAAARRHTWHYSEYPLQLPPTFLSALESIKLSALQMKDAFAPVLHGAWTADHELAALTRGADGDRKKLDTIMLRQVRVHGEFDIPSVVFEDQAYTFKLNRNIQTGTQPALEIYYDSLLVSAVLAVHIAPKCLFSANTNGA